MAPDPESISLDTMLPLVHRDLRALADSLMRNERPDHTLQTTALVHEAYLRLRRRDATGCRTAAQLIAVAAQTMRQVLVDHARARRTDKRGGGGRARLATDQLAVSTGPHALDLLALDDALRSFAVETPRAARVVELRFFGGLTIPEIAALLGVTERTIERDWRYAQAWLRRAMTAGTPSVEDSHD